MHGTAPSPGQPGSTEVADASAAASRSTCSSEKTSGGRIFCVARPPADGVDDVDGERQPPAPHRSQVGATRRDPAQRLEQGPAPRAGGEGSGDAPVGLDRGEHDVEVEVRPRTVSGSSGVALTRAMGLRAPDGTLDTPTGPRAGRCWSQDAGPVGGGVARSAWPGGEEQA